MRWFILKTKLVTLTFNKKNENCIVAFADNRTQPKFIKHQNEIETIIKTIKSLLPDTDKFQEISILVYLVIDKDTPYIQLKVNKRGRINTFIRKEIDEMCKGLLPIFSEIVLETIRHADEF